MSKQICATGIDIIIILLLTSALILIEAITLPEGQFELCVKLTIIFMPLAYNSFFDLFFKGVSLGNKFFEVTYTVGEIPKYIILHPLFKTAAIFCWPASLWKLLHDEPLPYFKFFNMVYVTECEDETFSKENCEYFIRRLIATAVDFFVVLIFGGIVAAIILAQMNDVNNDWAQWVVLLLVFILYQMIFDWFMSGRTFGKQFMRIEIESEHNNYKLIFAHGCCKLFAILIFFISVPYGLKKGKFIYDDILRFSIKKTDSEHVGP